MSTRAMQLPSAGVRYMAYGAFWFSLMSLLVKVAGQRLPSIEIVLARALVSLVLSYVLLRHARIPIWGTNRRLLVLRGVLGFAALACFYYALVHLPLAEATVIQYMNPVFTAVLAALLLGERIGWWEGVCVAASLAGVLLIARPDFLFGGGTAAFDPLTVGVAVAGALLSAGAYVTVRRLGSSEHPLVIVFYFPLVTVPAAIPLVAPVAVWPQGWEWLVLLGVGVTTQVGQVYMTKGLQLVPAGRATAIGYLQIVFAGLWGVLLFAEYPDAWSIGGTMMIIGSTLALALWRGSGEPSREAAEATAPERSVAEPAAARRE